AFQPAPGGRAGDLPGNDPSLPDVSGIVQDEVPHVDPEVGEPFGQRLLQCGYLLVRLIQRQLDRGVFIGGDLQRLRMSGGHSGGSSAAASGSGSGSGVASGSGSASASGSASGFSCGSPGLWPTVGCSVASLVCSDMWVPFLRVHVDHSSCSRFTAYLYSRADGAEDSGATMKRSGAAPGWAQYLDGFSDVEEGSMVRCPTCGTEWQAVDGDWM